MKNSPFTRVLAAATYRSHTLPSIASVQTGPQTTMAPKSLLMGALAVSLATLVASHSHALGGTWKWDPATTGTGSDGSGTWNNAKALFSNGTSDVLYAPGVATRTVATTGSGSNLIGVASTVGVAVGEAISLNNFAVGTVVNSISGSTVTLSTSATSAISSNTAITFVDANDLAFGNGNGAAGTVTVSGTQYAGALTINAAGSGNYTFASNSIVLGTRAGSSGILTLKDSATINSLMNLKGISFAAPGKSLALNGGSGSFGSGNGIIGGTNAAISVASSLLLASGTYSTGGVVMWNIGDVTSGTAGIIIQPGATLNETSNNFLGYFSNSPGLASLKGGAWNISSGANLVLGRTYLGRTIIQSGTLSAAGTITVGHLYTGQLDVNGGLLTSSTTLAINSGNGNGTVNITGGTALFATVNFGGGGYGGVSGSGTGTLNMSGGTLYVGGGGVVRSGTGTFASAINLSGGTLAATVDWASTMPMNLSNTVTFQAADSVNTAHSIALSGVLSGSGGLSKTGSGKLTLLGSNTYSGATMVNAGTLALGNSAALSTSSNVSIGSGATLDVSALSPVFTLGPGQALNAAAGSYLIGAADAGTGTLTLAWNGTDPALTVTGGVFTLHDNSVTVNNLSGTALDVGSYPVVLLGSGGSIGGSVAASAVTVAGAGVVGTHPAALAITGTSVDLVISNRNPVASNLAMTATNGLAATLQIIGGTQAPTDADGDPLTITSVSTPAHGSVATDGTSVTFTPTDNYIGTEAFNYTVSDGEGGSATATVTLTIVRSSQTWSNGGSDLTWNLTSPDWGGAAWINGNDAVFGSAGAGTITVGTGVSANSVTFNVSGYTLQTGTLTLTSSTNALTLASNVATTFNNPVAFSAGTTLTVGTGGSLTLNGGGSFASGNTVFKGPGSYNITGGTYTGAGNSVLWLQANMSQTGASSISASVLLLGYGGASTYTLNSSAASLNLVGTGVGSNYCGRAGTAGVLDLKQGTVTLSGGLNLTRDSSVNSKGTLLVEGGTLSTGTNALVINEGGITSGQTAVATLSGGTVTTPKIQFGQSANTYANCSGTLTLSGGTLYLGSGGIVETIASGTLAANINLLGGTIAATADWTSSLPMNLSNSTTLKAADASGLAHNITLAGILSGSGGITKTGPGALILSGSNSYTGATAVTSGTLVLNGQGSLSRSSSISLAAGTGMDVSALSPSFTLGAGQSFSAGITATWKGAGDAGSGTLSLPTDGSHPALTVSGGTFTLHNNAISVNITSGTALDVGSYPLIATGSGGTIAGSVSSSALTITGIGLSGSHQASLSVTGSSLNLVVNNRNPVASNESMSALSGLSFAQHSGPTILQIIGGALPPTDPDGDPLTVIGVGAASHGTVLTDGTNLIYTANDDFTGTDSFTYTVGDGKGGTATASVSVTVTAKTGATVPFITYEAEDGTLAGGAIVRSLSGPATTPWDSPELEASGRAFVELKGTGQSVSWTNANPQPVTMINLRYSIPDAPTGGGTNATINLYVDGVYRQSISLSSVQTWLYEGTTWDGMSQDPSVGNPHIFYVETHRWITGAPIAPGSRITLQQDADNTAAFYWIDLVDLETPPPAGQQPSNSLSIVDYGAVPTSTSEGPLPGDAIDSGTAIQNCINAAASQGKSVWIPPGRFMFFKGLSLKSVLVEGAGMWYSSLYRNIPLPSTYQSGALSVTSGTTRNFYLDTNSIDRTQAGGDFAGINIGGDNYLVENLWIQHTSSGVWASGNYGLIRNCRATDTWGDGVNLNNGNTGNHGNYLTAENNFVRGVGDDGVTINSDVTSTQMDTITLRNNTTVSVYWADGLRIAGGRNVLVENNLLVDPVKFPGIIVGIFNGAPLESGTVQNNVILRGGGDAYNQNRAALVVGSSPTGPAVENVVVKGNMVLDSMNNALSITTCSNIVLESNTFDNIWESNPLPSPRGCAVSISSDAVGSLVLLNNSFVNLPSGQTPLVDNSLDSNFALGGAGNVGIDIPAPIASPWSTQDIGSVGATGAANQSPGNGTFTLAGSGIGIADTSDEFRFLSQSLTGDGEIRARVRNLENVGALADSGIMMRSSLDPGSANAAILMSPTSGITFQWRSGSYSTTAGVQSPGLAAPMWVSLVRQGNTVTGYSSPDQITWTALGTQSLSLGSTVSAGLAVSSGSDGALCSSMFDNVATPAVPSPWTAQDIGAVGLGGRQTFCPSTGAFSLTASGGDIWNTSDAFRYLWQPASGDCNVVARVAALGTANPWSKAGVMIRESTAANSANAAVVVTASNGVSFQWRTITGGTCSLLTSPGLVAPYWVQLARTGSTFTASASADGATWTVIGSATVPMAANVTLGLAATSHDNTVLNSALLDTVTTNVAPSPWAAQDIGSVVLSGSTLFSPDGTFTVTGAGADIWGSSDAFQYVYQPLSGNGTITAKVEAEVNTNSWAKAGVMIRNSLSASDQEASVFVTPGAGVVFASRSTAGGATVNNVITGGLKPPYWVRLTRSGTTFTASRSPNGVTWTTMGTATLSMGSNVYVGLPVTSHNTSQVCTATISNVTIASP